MFEELALAEYEASSRDRNRAPLAMIVYLYLIWAALFSSLFVAIFSSDSLVKLGGVSLGALVTALGLLMRSTAMAVHRQASDSSRKAIDYYRRATTTPQRSKSASVLPKMSADQAPDT